MADLDPPDDRVSWFGPPKKAPTSDVRLPPTDDRAQAVWRRRFEKRDFHPEFHNFFLLSPDDICGLIQNDRCPED